MAIIPDVNSRLEAARLKLASLRPQTDAERELLRTEEDIFFEEMKAKAAKNVRLGRHLLKDGGQVVFRQMTGPELKSATSPEDPDMRRVAWVAAQRKCIVHPTLPEYDELLQLYPLLDEEVATCLNHHMHSVRAELPGK